MEGGGDDERPPPGEGDGVLRHAEVGVAERVGGRGLLQNPIGGHALAAEERETPRGSTRLDDVRLEGASGGAAVRDGAMREADKRVVRACSKSASANTVLSWRT